MLFSNKRCSDLCWKQISCPVSQQPRPIGPSCAEVQNPLRTVINLLWFMEASTSIAWNSTSCVSICIMVVRGWFGCALWIDTCWFWKGVSFSAHGRNFTQNFTALPYLHVPATLAHPCLSQVLLHILKHAKDVSWSQCCRTEVLFLWLSQRYCNDAQQRCQSCQKLPMLLRFRRKKFFLCKTKKQSAHG